ncbi:hypothetical protein QQ045_025617 [Rhodiola kirilowii]
MSINLDIGRGSGISGPTNFNTSSCNMMMNNVAGYGGVGEPVDVRRQLMQQQQPFDISTTCGSVSKSPGGGASMGFFPFTNAQWKELERQAMVFKYMMHSIPVPYELLFPFITATNPPGIGRDAHLLKFLKNGDPEPGRCRRTDGKKWRCSNAVALDQKYCEKHVHRGRPRSRKHVEAASDLSKNNKKPCLAHNQTNAATASAAAAVSVSKPISTTQIGAKLDPDQLSRSTAGYNINSNAAFQLPLGNKAASIASHFPSSHLRNGDLSEEEWHQLMQFKSGHSSNLSTYSNTSIFQPLSLNSYTPFSSSQDTQPKPEFNLFLQANLKRPATNIIDASWTVNGNTTKNNNSHDLVSLGLSMGHEYGDCDSENKQSRIGNWMTQSGGPLGEVLRPTGTHTIPPLGSSSPTTATGVEDSCNNNSPQMSSSSASGVLQKAVASLSDSTRHSNSDPKTRFPSHGFQWLNQEQDKLLQQSF